MTKKNLVYPTTKWSDYQFSRARESDPGISTAIESGQGKNPHFEQFSSEVFSSLYSGETERVENPLPEAEWAHTYAHELESTPDYKRLQGRCRGDKFRTGLAAEGFLKRVSDKLPQAPGENPEEIREELKGLLDFAKTMKAEGKGIPDGMRQKIETLKAKGKQAVEDFKGYAQGMDRSDIRSAIRHACDEAEKGISDVEESLQGFGWGDGPGDTLIKGNTLNKAELARRIRDNPKMVKLAKLAGRMRRVAVAKRAAMSDGRDYIHGVTMGDDISRLLPTELSALGGDPLRFLDFGRRLNEKTLMQYALKGKTPKDKGPIVVLLDCSGSMEGDREVWSKAVCLAILHVAMKDKRSVRVIHFNHGIARQDDWKPADGVDPTELLDSMAHGCSGGTAYDEPLLSALEALGESEYDKSDIVMITDGECYVSDDVSEDIEAAKRDKGLTIYGVHVDAPGGVDPESLTLLCDKVVGLADLSDDSAATDMVFSL